MLKINKKLFFIVIFISFCFIIVGCNNDKNAEKVLSSLILNKEKIDLLWISEGNNPSIKIKDKNFISKLLEKSADINVSKLSIEEEKNFLLKFEDDTTILMDFHETS